MSEAAGHSSRACGAAPTILETTGSDAGPLLPERGWMDVAELLTWIMFRRALPIRQWPPGLEEDPRRPRAVREAITALGAGDLHAWGRRGRDTVTPDLKQPLEPIQREVWGPHMDLLPYPSFARPVLPGGGIGGPRFDDVRFATDEVLALWKPPAPAPSVWMRREAQRIRSAGGPPPKRDDVLARCRSETGCTKRQAEVAWEADFPKDLKRDPRMTDRTLARRQRPR